MSHGEPEDRNHIIISIDTEKTFDQTQDPFMNKAPKTKKEKDSISISQRLYAKPTANFKLN